MLSREKVEAVLFKMGMPANVKGFGYIVDSVLLLEEDSKIKTTYLYFKVAQQHGTTGQRVERAIRHAFDIVRSCRGDYDVVNHYIGFINCANSPSLSMLTIAQMTGDLVKAYPFLSDAEAQRFGTGKEEIGKCPRCGSPVYVGKGNFYCSNKECSFCLWEDNKFFSSKKKKLTKKIAKELLDKGWCRVTGLYTPKKPQLYDAVIRLDDSGGKYVSFKMEFDR